MRLPRLSILGVFLHEILSDRALRREPETALVMEESEEASAYDEAGQFGGALSALYVFILAHGSQAIEGCKKVLDLGCGPGNHLFMLAKLHPTTEFVGLDLSDSMLQIARDRAVKLGLKNVTFQKMDISTLSGFADKSVDGVISTFALHHLPTVKHLDQLFLNVRRVLAPNGALFFFDFGRLKSLKTVIYFAYRDRRTLPYRFTLDYERSLRAAFSLEDFQQMAAKHLGPEVVTIGTFKVPLMILLKTPDRTLPTAKIDALREERRRIPPVHREDLDDLRLFFFLSGLRNDPFGAFLPGSDFYARLRLHRLSHIKTQYYLFVHRMTRIGFLGLNAIPIGLGFLLAWISPHSVRSRIHSFIGQRLYKTLGHLKGPIMKFGQMLSYLPIGWPAEITRPLDSLQDTVSPLDGHLIRKIVEKELGQSIPALFSEWQDQPIAAASISQIHFARRRNGQAVAVKVKYPKIETIVTSDLKNLKALAPFLRRQSGLENVAELLSELESLIHAECDFTKAANFQDEFRQLFKDDPEVVIPKVHRDLSTAEVLTMDYIDGQSYAEFKEFSSQTQKNKAAEIIWRFAATSINRYCLYNADPHPGNYLFLPGQVCFLDFGFTRRFTPEFMDNWKEQSLAGCAGDLERFRLANERLGYVLDPSNFDHKKMLETYREVLYESWGEDRTYTFHKDFVSSEFKALTDLIKSQKGNRMPTEFLSILRLLGGQHAILADLNAEANWHRVVFPLLKEKTRP